MRIWMKTGVKRDGTMTANEMRVLSDTGAYGCHAVTSPAIPVRNPWPCMSAMARIGNPLISVLCRYRLHQHSARRSLPRYGVPQAIGRSSVIWKKIARALGLDPLEFRLKNAIRPGEYHPFSTAWNEGREPRPEIVHTVGLEQCVQQGKAAIGWDEKSGNETWRKNTGSPHLRKGIGVAMVMQGTPSPTSIWAAPP